MGETYHGGQSLMWAMGALLAELSECEVDRGKVAGSGPPPTTPSFPKQPPVMMFPIPLTPPHTQQPVLATATAIAEPDNSPRRHERFYETEESLQDPVILRVRCQLATSCEARALTPPGRECTLQALQTLPHVWE